MLEDLHEYKHSSWIFYIAPRVRIYYLYKLNVFFFFLPDILKVLIDQVSTEGKLTIEWLSAASVKAMDYNSFYSVFNTINLEVFHFMWGPALPSNCVTQIECFRYWSTERQYHRHNVTNSHTTTLGFHAQYINPAFERQETAQTNSGRPIQINNACTCPR